MNRDPWSEFHKAWIYYSFNAAAAMRNLCITLDLAGQHVPLHGRDELYDFWIIDDRSAG